MDYTKNSQIDKLMELKQLYEQGILTKEEMEVEKQKILNNSTSKKPERSVQDPEPRIEPVVSPASQVVEEDSIFEEDEEQSFFDKYKAYIVGGIALVLVIAGIAFVPKIISHSNDIPISDVSIEEIGEPVALKGKINNKIGFSMQLQCTGNEVNGTEHYDSQKSEATVTIKGTIAEGHMILHEYDNGLESGKFEGSFDNVTFTGTFTNSKGKVMPFTARVLSEEYITKEEDAIKAIGEKGTILANVDGKIFYIEKIKDDNRYDAEGENCGKLYIHNIADGTTSYERILIPSGESYSIEECKYRDMKITFVLYDVGRNGFGIGNYCTEVSQYNIKTGQWKDIAEGCAKAEFTDNNKKIKITTAIVINSEAESACDYKYEYTDEIIDL